MNTLGFELASGSVQGRDHRIAGRNNQDAVVLLHRKNVRCGVVGDGCGSSQHSEVGAWVETIRLAKEIDHFTSAGQEDLRETALSDPLFSFWEAARRLVLYDIDILQGHWANEASEPESLQGMFFSTLLAVVVTPETTVFATIGDGALVINGEQYPLGPFPNNAPPYLAYDIGKPPDQKTRNQFNCLTFKTDEIQHFLLGTDGVLDLMRTQDRKIPHATKHELVGPISQFWTEDRYFKNSDAIRRRLTLINRDIVIPDWERRLLITETGLLPDDTTFIVGRRAPAST